MDFILRSINSYKLAKLSPLSAQTFVGECGSFVVRLSGTSARGASHVMTLTASH